MLDLAKVLGRVWHFRHLSVQDLSAIVSIGAMRRYPEGRIIFHEGDECAGMFVLLRGKVHLCRLGPTSQEQIISTIEPVIMFNEISVIDGGRNPYTARAAKRCLTWNISHADFTELVRRYPDPEIGLGFLRVMASRTRLLINRCEDISYRPVLARLAKLLLDLSGEGCIEINRAEYPIKTLAAHIASVPEVVSRSLTALSEQGVVHSDRQSISILDIEGLTKIARD
jgi:CRP/FNR family transcriptional regulator